MFNCPNKIKNQIKRKHRNNKRNSKRRKKGSASRIQSQPNTEASLAAMSVQIQPQPRSDNSPARASYSSFHSSISCELRIITPSPLEPAHFFSSPSPIHPSLAQFRNFSFLFLFLFLSLYGSGFVRNPVLFLILSQFGPSFSFLFT